MTKYFEKKFDKRLGGDYVALYDEDIKFLGNKRVIVDMFGKLFYKESGEPVIGVEIINKRSNTYGLRKGEELSKDFVIAGDYIDAIPDPNKRSGLL